jgi:predicted XRE-type DNA-binding protein
VRSDARTFFSAPPSVPRTILPFRTKQAEITLGSDLNSKIVEVVRCKGLTHAQVARLARSSRTRVTAIMNRNTKDISIDLLLRVLYFLGYTAKIKLQKAA